MSQEGSSGVNGRGSGTTEVYNVLSSSYMQHVGTYPNVTATTCDEDEYNMGHERRGVALIFNHNRFELRTFENGGQCRPAPRLGTIADRERLSKTFSQLGFRVECLEDQSFSKIKGKLEEVAGQDHSRHDCLAVVVLTHGDEGGWLEAWDRTYNVRELWVPFIATNCPRLAGKPKLFFIQACRGGSNDTGVSVPNMYGDFRDAASRNIRSFNVPSYSDIVISYSTFEGLLAVRNDTCGSWYVRTLCEQLTKHAANKDLVSLLTDVNRIVGQSFSSTDLEPMEASVQGPCFISSLTHLLHLGRATNDAPSAD